MSGRLVSPTFIGRREALSAAAALVDGLERGRAGTLLVGGEAGIGKTRFCAAAGAAAEAGGVLVLRAASVRLASGELPYAPIAALLRGMARSLEPADLASVAGPDDRVLGRIAGIGGPRTRDPGDEPPETARERLLHAFLELVGRLAALRPVMLVVEDLHWADSASLDVLAFLVHSLTDERAGLLLTMRTDELHRRHPLRPWLAEVERLASVQRLDLAPFSTAETRDLIAAIRRDAPPAELVDAVHERAGGNPLFIEELVASELTTAAALSPSLRDILLARVAGVPEDGQLLLRVAAIAGRQVGADLLAEVSGLAAAAFDAALEASRERGVLVHEHDAAGDRVVFRHALIQEVIEEAILPGERIRLHRAFAEALARRLAGGGSHQPGTWAELADHWDAARDEPRAFQAALLAADEAVHAYAFSSALTQFRRALTGWELTAEPDAVAGFDRIELLSRAAEAAWLSGQDQVALLREAVVEADRSNDVRGALLRGRLGYALWVSGEPMEARGVYEEAVTRLPPGPPTPERAWLLARLGQALMLEASYRESVRLAEAGLATARDAGDRRAESHALNTIAGASSELGQGNRAIDTIERALAVALDLGAPDEVGRAYLNATEVLATCGLDHRALALVWEGIDRTTSMGMAQAYASLIAVHGASIAYDLGRWSEATELAQPMLDAHLDPNTEVYVLARVVPLSVGSGRANLARTQLDGMRRLLERFAVEAQYSGPYSAARAEMALWDHRPAEALEAVGWGLARLEQTDDVRHRLRLRRLGLRGAADLAIAARDRRLGAERARADEAARSIHERTDPLLEAIAAMDGGLAAELAAEVATAAAEEARSRGVAEPALWREAGARWGARERPYARAYTCWREAEACLATDRRREAGEALHAAADIARQLGAAPMWAEIAALARRARVPLDRHGPGDAARPAGNREALLAAEFGLTRRELDVLQLLSRGKTNRQIAEDLFISVYTAGVHVSRILGKLDVTSRTEAASKAYRLGLVSR